MERVGGRGWLQHLPRQRAGWTIYADQLFPGQHDRIYRQHGRLRADLLLRDDSGERKWRRERILESGQGRDSESVMDERCFVRLPEKSQVFREVESFSGNLGLDLLGEFALAAGLIEGGDDVEIGMSAAHAAIFIGWGWDSGGEFHEWSGGSIAAIHVVAKYGGSGGNVSRIPPQRDAVGLVACGEPKAKQNACCKQYSRCAGSQRLVGSIACRLTTITGLALVA